jgi:hypothetical protein
MAVSRRSVSATGAVETFTPTQRLELRQVALVLRQRAFHKLAAAMACITVVRLIFRVLDAAFPKYMERGLHTDWWGK